MPMIQLKEVSKSFQSGDTLISALDTVSLDIQEQEIFGVIGPSGAGKSTLIRCVNLLERPDKGEIIINDQNLMHLSTGDLRVARKKIGMIFQHFNLLNARTVFDNIVLPLTLSGVKEKAIKEKIAPLLALTGLEEHQDRYPEQLSGGQKQRVAIARALITDPKALLCDEATSALDPDTTHAILQLLNQVNKELGITIMLITHEMAVVKEICHRLAIMENGKIVEQSEVINFVGNPQTDLAKRFIRRDVRKHLPPIIAERLQKSPTEKSNPLWRLSFIGKSSQEPLIAHLMQNLDVKVNILQANIELIRDELVGTLVIEASGGTEQISTGKKFLTDKGIFVETIGYVPYN